MPDSRIVALTHTILDYALDLRPGEKLLIEGEAGCEPLVAHLIPAVYERGAIPFFEVTDPKLRRAQLMGCSREALDLEVRWRLERLKEMDAHLYIAAGENAFEFTDIPPRTMQQFSLARTPLLVQTLRRKWSELRFPTASAAQAAGMSTHAFEDFLYRVSTLDYAKMDGAMDPLVALMGRTDRVRITGPGTDLTFSIKGLPVRKCSGKLNIPDGEVFTAPVKNSADGRITYNTPSLFQGTVYEQVSLLFREGRIVEATGNFPDKINQILDTDEGARYLGEFALGLNPHIERPMRDTLFDEKISGSLHLTPGNAYEDADNGNRSAIHWDLVLIQRPESGGGELYFDGELIRKDGLFVTDDLAGLNPEALKGQGGG